MNETEEEFSFDLSSSEYVHQENENTLISPYNVIATV